MVLTISTWFGEPGIKFQISYKVYKYIRHLLIEEVMKPFGLEEKDTDIFLGLVITTTKSTETLEVRGPEFDKRNKFINYGLWLPYQKIHNADNELKAFLHYYFEALVILFEKYDVAEAAIRTVQEKVEKEVLNNADYDYSE